MPVNKYPGLVRRPVAVRASPLVWLAPYPYNRPAAIPFAHLHSFSAPPLFRRCAVDVPSMSRRCSADAPLIRRPPTPPRALNFIPAARAFFVRIRGIRARGWPRDRVSAQINLGTLAHY